MGKKGPKLAFRTNGGRKVKFNSKGKFEEINNSFIKPLFQKLEVLTPRDDVTNTKLGQKRLKLEFNVDRIMKIKSKRYFEVNYLFMKPFSQNFEVLTQRSKVINPKLA